jgi:hypothetical protein
MATFTALLKPTYQMKTVAPGFAEPAWGVDLSLTATVTITVPTMTKIWGAMATSNTSTTAVICDTPSGNTFKITKADSDVVTWMAFGLPRL